MSATDEDSCSSQQQLQEENFVLRTQVVKLQVALRNALSREKDDGPHPAPLAVEEYVSKQQLEVVMGELADLRLQVNHLHAENRSLQAQLQQVREVQAASASSSGAAAPWEPAAAVSSGVVDPITRHDIAFIEREVNCLKQKISETRLKLQRAEPATPEEFSPEPACGGDLRRALQQQRQPLQQRRQAAAGGRTGAGPATRPFGTVDVSLFRDLLPHRSVTPRPSSATGSAVPPARATRGAHGTAGKKAVTRKPAKENAPHQAAGAKAFAMPKPQRGRGFAY